jgi:hypothetical protein
MVLICNNKKTLKNKVKGRKEKVKEKRKKKKINLYKKCLKKTALFSRLVATRARKR